MNTWPISVNFQKNEASFTWEITWICSYYTEKTFQNITWVTWVVFLSVQEVYHTWMCSVQMIAQNSLFWSRQNYHSGNTNTYVIELWYWKKKVFSYPICNVWVWQNSSTLRILKLAVQLLAPITINENFVFNGCFTSRYENFGPFNSIIFESILILTVYFRSCHIISMGFKYLSCSKSV